MTNKLDGEWDSTANIKMQEFSKSALCIHVSISIAQAQERKRVDSLQRRNQLCGNADENHRLSQSSQLLQSSSDFGILGKKCGGLHFSKHRPQHFTRISDEAGKARNLRFVLSCVERSTAFRTQKYFRGMQEPRSSFSRGRFHKIGIHVT